MNNDVLDKLCAVIQAQQILITSIANKLTMIENIGGGGGTATINDYASGEKYKRNTLLVDPNTETLYRVISTEYTSVTVEADITNGNLKLVGFENAIVTFNHEPTQDEINTIPDESLVAVYSSTDTPYMPST